MKKHLLMGGALLVSLGLGGCAEKTQLPSEQVRKLAPQSQSQTGYLILGVTPEAVAGFAQQNKSIQIRPIYPKKGLYEVFNTSETHLKLHFPQATVAKNKFFIRPQQTEELTARLLNPEECKVPPKDLTFPHQINGNVTTKTAVQLGTSVKLAIENINSLKDDWQYLWQVRPPKGSLLSNTKTNQSEFQLTPDSLGGYQLLLIIRDSQGYCQQRNYSFYVTDNPQYLKLKKAPHSSIEEALQYMHLKEMKVDLTWPQSTGAGQIIAIIDSGINYNSEYLNSNVLLNTHEIPGNGIDDDENGFSDDYLGYDFINNDEYPFDDHGHGSHVAGLAASPILGVAPEAKILAIKAMSPFGGDIGSFAGAIFYAVDREAKIINMSFGEYGRSHPLLEAAIDFAESAGALIIAAAGNGDNLLGLPVDTDIIPMYPSSYNNENIISVAAKSEVSALASYSNYGRESVDIVALGGEESSPLLSVFSDNPANIRVIGMAGTSMAAALVSGAIAQIWATAPHISEIKLKEMLMTAGKPLPQLKSSIKSARIIDSSAVMESLLCTFH